MRYFAQFLAGASIAAASACALADQPLNPPQLVPLGDSNWWILVEPLRFRIGISNEVMTVPRGFVTDLASTPQALWSMLPKTGQYMTAAVLHDYLYWDQRCSRSQADRIFEIEMLSFGVKAVTASLVFAGVRDFGSTSWSNNAEQKARNAVRFVPAHKLSKILSEPFHATSTWQKLQEELSSDPSIAASQQATQSEANPDLARTCTRAIEANPVKE
jgi:hypothetical protein